MKTDIEKNPTAQALSYLLADSYTLYLKSHNYHWNVTGPMFSTLHLLFEQLYTELAPAVDEIAERIRALNYRAPGSYREFQKLSTVQDASGEPSATEMISQLADDLDQVVLASKAVFKAAEAASDQASGDLAVRRMDISQKFAWMLRSHLA